MKDPTITLRCLSKDGSNEQTVVINAVKLLGACQHPGMLDELMVPETAPDGEGVHGGG